MRGEIGREAHNIGGIAIGGLALGGMGLGVLAIGGIAAGGAVLGGVAVAVYLAIGASRYRGCVRSAGWRSAATRSSRAGWSNASQRRCELFDDLRP